VSSLHSPGIRLLLTLATILSPAWAQETQSPVPPAPMQAHISFDFARIGLPVPKYRLDVRQDGSATYEGEAAEQTTSPLLTPQPFTRTLTLSSSTTAHLFALSLHLKHFAVPCASKAKNMADTGTKTLTYTGSDATGSCTYNFSENKDVEQLTQIFQGIAETMDEGRELDRLHRFDRLGLDAATSLLSQEISAGRALEVQTIAASLDSIASDADVMERVRLRAKTLLAHVPPEAAPR
jgi:hypothetical protein